MISAKEAYELSKQAKDKVCKEIENVIKEKAREGHISCSYIIDDDILSEDRVTEIEELLVSKGYQYHREENTFYTLEIYWGD